MSRASILIVEDEAIVAADLASKLRQLGYGISGSTARGEEAVNLARDRRPDLVLMDIRLAGAVDGVAAAERIRRECGVPVIYLTAHSDSATLHRAKVTEPFGYVLKPFETVELEAHIEMALYKHQAEQALARTQEDLRVTNEELAATNEELTASNEELAAANEDLAVSNEELRVASEQLHANAEQLMAVTEELRVSNETLEARVEQRTLRLHQLARELNQAEERERQRIAKILHDHLQQLLVGAKLQLEVLRDCTEPQVVHKQAERAQQLITESVDISRGLAYELSPPVLEEGGLAAALKWLGGWMRERHGLTVRVEADGAAERLEKSVKVLLFQSVRELLFNAVKHAGVKQARVRMGLREDGLMEVLVSDKGRGFDPAEARPEGGNGGLGLFSIRERLALLGGRLEVESEPGHGACFRLIAPVHNLATR